jgi:hypothetical protein
MPTLAAHFLQLWYPHGTQQRKRNRSQLALGGFNMLILLGKMLVAGAGFEPTTFRL